MASELAELLKKWREECSEAGPKDPVLPWPYDTYRQLYDDWHIIMDAAGIPEGQHCGLRHRLARFTWTTTRWESTGVTRRVLTRAMKMAPRKECSSRCRSQAQKQPKDSRTVAVSPFISKSARERTRTSTGYAHWILNPARLPIPPLSRCLCGKRLR